MPEKALVVEAKNVKKNYWISKTELAVLKGIQLQIFAGEIVTVVGPSGVGKSTLLHILGALDKPTSGEVVIDGIGTSELSDDKMARFRNERIGFVFQFHHLLPEFTALENVMMPALISGEKMNDVKDRARDLLKKVGLEARVRHRPNELSGGEQQRVAVARALMNNPRLILADEPSGNLDRDSAEMLHDMVFKLCREKEQTFVIVTHNTYLAERSDRVIKMYDGRISSETHP